MTKLQNPLLETEGDIAATHWDDCTIPTLNDYCNDEITLEADQDYTNSLLLDCATLSEMKAQIMKLYVSGVLPDETVQRLFRRYRLRGC